MAALPFARRPEAESMAGSVCTDTEIVGRPKLVEKMQKCSFFLDETLKYHFAWFLLEK